MMSVSQAQSTFETAKPFVPEPPRPLRRRMPPADRFPIDALGGVLQAAAEAIVDQVQCPPALAGQSVLAAATLAVQGQADVEMPTGEIRPVSNFLVSIAASGERKSTADQIALSPIQKREKALREEHEADLLSFQNALSVWESERKQALSKSSSQRDKEQALDELGPPPMPPLEPLLTCPEPTFEGLCRLLQAGHPSVGVFSSEGGQFVGGHGMNPDHRLKTAAALSGIWDGEPIKRVRAGDGVVIMPGRRMAMHLMLQPGVAARLLGDGDLADQGLLSRLLISAPASTAGTRFWREAKPESKAAIRRYHARILSILETPLPLASGKKNELAPRKLPLSGAARIRWTEFANHVETEIGPGRSLAPIRALGNKLAQHAARLAAVLTLVHSIDQPDIPTEMLEQGVVLAEHYVTEARRLTEHGDVSPDILLAEEVLAWLHQWPEDLVALPDVYQLGPPSVREAKTARCVLGVLEEHGWLARIDGGAEVRGRRRRDVWQITRAEAA